MRLVVDTNVLISSFTGGRLGDLALMLTAADVEVFTSRDQIAELLDVVERPRFRKYITVAEGRSAVADFCLIAEIIDVPTAFPAVCRDPKDDYLLALAKAAKADVLITGDKDLLELEKYGSTVILKPSALRKRR